MIWLEINRYEKNLCPQILQTEYEFTNGVITENANVHYTVQYHTFTEALRLSSTI